MATFCLSSASVSECIDISRSLLSDVTLAIAIRYVLFSTDSRSRRRVFTFEVKLIFCVRRTRLEAAQLSLAVSHSSCILIPCFAA